MFLRLLILTAAFASVSCFCTALYRLIIEPRRDVQRRLAGDTASGGIASSGPGTGRGVAFKEFRRILGKVGQAVSGRSYIERTRQKLLYARLEITAEEFAGVSLLSAAAALLLVYLLFGSIPAAVLAALPGFKLPSLVVEAKRRRRLEALNRQLPEALSIISNGMRAGFSFIQAISVVSREMEPPIADEFSRVIRENRLGKPLPEALQDLTGRTESDDLELMVTALLIQRQVGGNLAEILDNISGTIRERIRIKGEIRTLTAQGRISAVIVSIIPLVVACAVLLINPEYILILFREPLGLFLVGTAILMQIAGILLIRKIVNIDV